MKNWQERLDQQPPAAFDRQGLWQRIERPRRRQVAIWWWIGAAAMVLFGGGWCLWSLHSFGPTADNESRQSAMPTLQPPSNSQPPKPNRAQKKPATPFMPAISDVEAAPPPATSKAATEAVASPQAKEASPFCLPFLYPWNVYWHSAFYAQALPSQSARHWPMAGAAGLRPVAVLPDPIQQPQRPPSEKQIPLQPRSTSALGLLPAPPPAPIDMRKPPRLLASTGKAAPLFQSRHAFALSGGLSSQVHAYRTSCGLSGKENARPGFYLSTQYQRSLGKGCHLAATARYSVHHSRFSGEHSTYSRSINLLNEELRTVKTTFYALYNQYSRADLSLGLGKTWESEGLAFSLSVSTGYSWWAQREGSYLDPNGQVQRIASADTDGGSWAFGLHTAIFRPLSQHIAIGVEASATAPLLLYRPEGGCAQRAAPIAFGILLRRQ